MFLLPESAHDFDTAQRLLELAVQQPERLPPLALCVTDVHLEETRHHRQRWQQRHSQ